MKTKPSPKTKTVKTRRVTPVRPKEIIDGASARIPNEVIEIFNHLIAKEWNGSSATIYQDTVVKAIVARLKIPRTEVFNRNYLDVERMYMEAGWCVYYDKPAYDETYDAHFIFSHKGI